MPVFLICYAAAFFLSRLSQFALSGTALIFAACYLYIRDTKPAGRPVSLKALFTLSFVGGEGISCLKLSQLQTQWKTETWLCLLLICIMFRAVFALLSGKKENPFAAERKPELQPVRSGRLLTAILGIAGLSLISFGAEAAILGFVPLLMRGVPHAYSYFHVHGLHYFTVSCVLVPAFAVLWFRTGGAKRRAEVLAVTAAVFCALLVPILCVSRFQLIMAVAVAYVTFLMTAEKAASVRSAAAVLACMIPLYVLLTVARSHSAAYLNGIFEMKYRLPVFISQPYIYIANNYDNFDCLVRELPAHTYGLRLLFPVWALSGLKFLKPELAAFPIYVTRKELTTVTLFYDAWYDFGTAGAAAFAALLGLVSWKMECRMTRRHNPVTNVLYAQIAVYLGLSFFTTWFSNPATWFYFAETLAVYLFVRIKPDRRRVSAGAANTEG